MEQEKSAADQVKEAVWQYTQSGLVLLVVFLAGVFLGFQLWGAGEQGAPMLRRLKVENDQKINKLTNEREDCNKVLQVTRERQGATEKELAALKAKAATP